MTRFKRTGGRNRGLGRNGCEGSGVAGHAEAQGAVVAGEVRLELPGRQQHLGDAAQLGRIVAGLNGPGAGFDRELAGKGEAVQGVSKSQ